MLCALSACSITGSNANNPLSAYTIEQNTIGTYVFCANDDCPKATPKTIAEALPYVPTPVVDTKPQYKYKVYFALGKSNLNQTATKHLNRWLPELKQANTIYLRGWADSVGGKNTAINRRLSKQRALNVQTWLKKRGVKAHVVLNSQPPCCNQQNTRIVAIDIKE